MLVLDLAHVAGCEGVMVSVDPMTISSIPYAQQGKTAARSACAYFLRSRHPFFDITSRNKVPRKGIMHAKNTVSNMIH